MLQRLRRLTHSLPSDSNRLFYLSYASLTSTFKEALRHLQLDELGYTLHSLRHGVETFEW